MKYKIKKFFSKKNNIIFILLVLSFNILPITYSRYISKGNGLETSLLAKWEVNMIENSDNSLELISKNASEVNYSFVITSTSDVACDYSLTISNVPNDVIVKVDDNIVNSSGENGTYSINNLGEFAVNSENSTHQHTITFISDQNTLAGQSTIDLNVKIKQKIDN